MESSPISSQALPPGTKIEEFIIERVLGSGGFGITYLAKDTALGRRVVIKENLPVQFCFRDTHSLTVAPRHSHGDDAENFKWSLENFSKEAAMVASLDHSGIVRVHRSFQAFGTAYFVMPFVEGLTVDDLIRERGGKSPAFAEEELKGLLSRVLKALSYPSGDVTDPTGPDTESAYIRRGGGWSSQPVKCRSAFRGISLSSERSSWNGLRLILRQAAG